MEKIRDGKVCDWGDSTKKGSKDEDMVWALNYRRKDKNKDRQINTENDSFPQPHLENSSLS